MNSEELDSLSLDELVEEMDEILSTSLILKSDGKQYPLSVRSLYETETVKAFASDFQRKIVYKTFGFLLQLLYTELSISAKFFSFPKHDEVETKQIQWAARCQWVAISSRIAFEYFMYLTYMLGTGENFEPKKSAIKKYKDWLKERDNPYTYFAISVARAMRFDRTKRSPEVHASTKLARHVLMQSADDIANEFFQLLNLLINQWRFMLQIADNRIPNGWASNGNIEDDEDWYNTFKSKDKESIDKAIDELFKNIEL